MTTPLILNAPYLLQTVTSYYYYPHLISYNPSTKRYEFQNPANISIWRTNILLFYVANLFVVPVIGLGSHLFQIIKYFLLGDKALNGFHIALFIALSFLSIFQWGYNIPVLKYGNCMISYINALLNLEALIKQRIELFYSSHPKKISNRLMNFNISKSKS